MKSAGGSEENVELDGCTAYSSQECCDLFAKFFSSVYSKPNVPAPTYNFDSHLNLSSCEFTTDEIQKKLASLDPCKGTGPDGIPPLVLKHCSMILAPQLTVFFNESLNNGVFPSGLKKSYVVPIHKSGSKVDVKNYRPIVIQPALAKVFEGLLLDKISFSLRSVLSPAQHGFVPGRSTCTNLLLLQHHILTAFASKMQLDCIYLDYSKAFDTVSHGHLIAKLEAYGVVGSLLRWCSSYLSGRTLIVKYAGTTSAPFQADSGVPQGSLLGPFLFNLFINDVINAVSSNCLMFADDIKIFAAIKAPSDCLILQQSLRSIEDWCLINCMNLNVAKCAIVTFHRLTNPYLEFNYILNDDIVPRKSSIRDLGVILNYDLNPEVHIDNICNRASKALGFLVRHSRCGLNVNTMRTLFLTLVRPILEYCCLIWNPYQINHIARIEKIQSRFLRSIGVKAGYEFNAVPIDDIGLALDLMPLEERRRMADLCFLFKILRGDVDSPDILALIDLQVPSLYRHQHLFSRRFHARNYAFHSAIPRIHRLGNSVGDSFDFFNNSLQQLKRALIQRI